MALPVPAEGICLAFDDGALDMGQTWTRIDTPGSSYVIAWKTQRGRASEFTPIEGGSGMITLQDRKGSFDPSNTTGSYYGLLDALLQAKINFQHPIAGTYHDVFSGYTDDLAYARQGPRGAETDLSLSDGFEPLAQAFPAPGSYYYAVQHVDDRIRAALGDAGWDADNTRIATGNVFVQAITYDGNSPILQICQEAALAEFPNVAQFFMDKSGYAAFSGRGIRFDPTSYPEWITFWRVGDDAACALDPSLLPVYDLKLNFGKESLFNNVICAPRNANETIIANSDFLNVVSKVKRGRRSLSLVDLLTLYGSTSGKTGIEECKDFARYFVNNYSLPLTRVTSIEFHGQMDDGTTTPGGTSGSLWDFILNVEINHIVEVNTVQPGGGGLVAKEFFVEGISNDVSNLNNKVPRWTMNLDLSPRARFASYP